MGRNLKRALLLAAALGCCLLLSGCLFNSSPEDMFSLPQLPPKYTALKERIDALLADGAESAAPTSGPNTQPVQLTDLDGDGTEEAVAFFRKNTDEKPLKIYIFRAQGESYEQAAVIEGNGTSIYSIAYTDMNGDGSSELVIGWKTSSTELQVLTVYALQDLQPQELVRVPYAKYATPDLNGDGCQELVVIKADSEGNSAADYYTWQDDRTLPDTPSSSARISSSVAELLQASTLAGSSSGTPLRAGRLQEGVPALFVTGVEESAIAITDILVDRGGELVNLALSSTTGVSTEVYRFLSLYPQDINADGVTEVPVPTALPTLGGAEEGLCYQINWRSYGPDGSSKTAELTYHDVTDGWYLVLPEAWEDNILVTRDAADPEEISVTFSYRGQGGEPPRDILRIYTISGDDPEYKAVRGNRFILKPRTETTYAAELPEEGQGWSGGITAEELSAAFNLILTEWAAGDY